MMNKLFLLILLFVSLPALAIEETCLVGDKNTHYEFYPDSQQSIGIPSMYQENFDSLNSACVSMLNKFLSSSFWSVGHISRSGSIVDDSNYYCEFTLKTSELPITEHIYSANVLKVNTEKDCSCASDQETRNFYGQCVQRCPNGSTFDGTKCVLTSCPDDQVLQGSTCVDKDTPPESCPEGQYRGDDNFCYPTPPQCASDEIFQNGQCVKKPDNPDTCAPDSKLAFLCEWYSDFKDLVYSANNYFNQSLEELQGNRATNESNLGMILTFLYEWSEQLKQQQQNENNGSQQTASDFSYNDRKTIIQNQEKQLAQDKEFQDETRDFYEFMKKEKDDSENPDNSNNGSVIEEQNIQTDEQQRVNWSATCPVSEAPKDISLNGLPATQLGFDNSEMCLIAQRMRPLVILAGAFISMLIIAGGLRK